VIVHSSRDLDAGDTRTHNRVPVTSPARTLVDLGAVAPASLVARCMEEWLADRKVRIAELQAAVHEHKGEGRRGIGVLRQALESRVLVDLRADSAVEALLACVPRRRKVPPPVLHHVVRLERGVIAELDYAYPDHRIALEVDG
jgi:hypothetical protein